MSGDPRAAFVDGVDTTKPNPVHRPQNTGVHGVGTGDPRAAWQSNSTVDPAIIQEEKDMRQAVGNLPPAFCGKSREVGYPRPFLRRHGVPTQSSKLLAVRSHKMMAF